MLWQVNALKYNLSRHYTWPATLVTADDGYIHLRNQVGGVLRHYTRRFEKLIQRRCELHFWKDRWYNVFVNFNDDDSFRNYYCNIALPPTLGKGEVTFVDLDLDVRIWADGRREVLDEDEFQAHGVEYGYPDWVKAGARQAVDEVLHSFEQGQYPFDLGRRS